MDVQKFGSTAEEVSANDMAEARQIVATILDYGVTQEQMVQIIKLLGLELLNTQDSRTIVAAAKSVQSSKASSSTLIT